jgi:hypothetical protein
MRTRQTAMGRARPPPETRVIAQWRVYVKEVLFFQWRCSISCNKEKNCE